MRWGTLSGVLWGCDTVILGFVLTLTPFLSSPNAYLAIAIFHDVLCAIILLAFMSARRRLGDTLAALRSRCGKAVALAAILGGPVGMSGYLLAINNIGPGYTAIVSTFYPALGALLAYFFLKERMSKGQVIALLIALLAVIAVGWSSTDQGLPGSPTVGIIGALACVTGWGSEAVILAWGMREDCLDNQTALHIRQTTSAIVYLAVVAPLSGALSFLGHSTFTPATALVFLAALAGTVSYLFYYRAISSVGTAPAMALNISYSAWAVIFSLLFLRTSPTIFQLLCCAVILCGTVLAATPQWRTLLPSRRVGTSLKEEEEVQ